MLRGEKVTLYDNGEEIEVNNVLIGSPSSSEGGLFYTLGIPKGDTHSWVDKKVHFFGMDFRTVGYPEQGIDALIPLDWSKNVKVELIKASDICTIYEDKTFIRHILSGVELSDMRGESYQDNGIKVKGSLDIHILSVNNYDNYKPKTGDFVVIGECDFMFDVATPQTISKSLALFRAEQPEYAVISEVQSKLYGQKPDFIIKAR